MLLILIGQQRYFLRGIKYLFYKSKKKPAFHLHEEAGFQTPEISLKSMLYKISILKSCCVFKV